MEPKNETGVQISLDDTCRLMCSQDYKDRFVAEYQQLTIRADRLSVMILKAENGQLDFVPTTPLWMLKQQLNMMEGYKVCLELRAQLEGIEI